MPKFIIKRKCIGTNALRLCLFAAMAGSLLFSWGAGEMSHALAQESIQIDVKNYAVDPSSSIDAVIDLASDSAAVAALTVELLYDPAVVTQTACSVVDFTGACNESVPGKILISAVNAAGKSGNSQIATITFEAIGAPGDSTALHVVVPTVVDITGMSLEHSVIDGTLLIRQPVNGASDSDQNRVYLPMVGRNSFKKAGEKAINLTAIEQVMRLVCTFMGNFGWTSDSCYIDIR